MLYTLTYNGMLIGYRLSTDYGDFLAREDAVNCDVFPNSSQVCIETSPGSYLTEDELSKGINIPDVSDSPILLDALLKLSGQTGSFNNYSIASPSIICKNLPLKTRKYFKELISLLDGSIMGSNIICLYGVRRTGKTISMLQAINSLIRKGTFPKEVVYISLLKETPATVNKSTSTWLMTLILGLRSLGVKYFFIDEITYISDNLGFLTSISDIYTDIFVVMSGTNISVFISPLRSTLYDRAEVISTSYISYPEFSSIYSNASLLDYIKVGGLMRSSKEYEKRRTYDYFHYAKAGVDYIGTSIIENLCSGLSRQDLKWQYPLLSNLWSQSPSQLKTIVHKWVMYYSNVLVRSIIEKEFSSNDIGNMVDLLLKHSEGLTVESISIFKERFLQLYKGYTNVKDYQSYSKDLSKELVAFFKEIGCYEYIPWTGNAYLLPIMVRYGCACDAIMLLVNNFKSLSKGLNLNINPNTLATYIENSVEDMLMEELVRLHLYKSGKYCYKIRSDMGEEIDIVSNNYYIEVKRSNQFNYNQLRWLVSVKQIYEDSTRKRMLLLNIPEDKEQSIFVSEKDTLGNIISEKTSKGMKVSRKLLKDYENARQEKVEILIRNIDKFLKEECSN